jgi:hypothetical protein
MILRYSSQQVRERDADGRLSEAGFFWTEERRSAESWFTASFYVAACLTGLGIGGIENGDPQIAAGIVAAPVLLAATLLLLHRYGRRARGVSFYSDGRIVELNGVPGRGKRYLIAGHWNMIGSVERARISGTNWPVSLHFRIGTSVCVAYATDEDEARIAVVQISQALQEMRDAQRMPAPVSALID